MFHVEKHRHVLQKILAKGAFCDTFTHVSLPSDIQTQSYLSSLEAVLIHSSRGTEHAMTSMRRTGPEHFQLLCLVRPCLTAATRVHFARHR